MEIASKRILVIGLGKTGEALIRFFLRRAARVSVSEKKNEEELGGKIRAWREKGLFIETGGHRLETFLQADIIIPSPGAASIPELGEAQKAGKEVLSEIELASRFLRGMIVGITGTNGKSTTATLAHKILRDAGRKAFLAGNIGTPLISFVETSRDDHIYVTEISSFQLEYICRFKAAISVFLNISQNHLDWHGSFDEYFNAKKKLIQSQGKEDIAILNHDDELVWPLAQETRARVYSFGQEKDVARGCFNRGGWLILRDGQEERLIQASKIPLLGRHNQDNVMAASLIGFSLGVTPASMRRSIRNFSGLEHRLEKFLTLRRVDFVNDSKATTVDATIKALQSFDKKIILILGGRDKGADFAQLRRPVKERVKKAILLGEAREKIMIALRGTIPLEEAGTLRQAVSLAFASSSPGDVVLLAPACTSFDMFKNFEARGRAFKKEVRRLKDSIQRRET